MNEIGEECFNLHAEAWEHIVEHVVWVRAAQAQSSGADGKELVDLHAINMERTAAGFGHDGRQKSAEPPRPVHYWMRKFKDVREAPEKPLALP